MAVKFFYRRLMWLLRVPLLSPVPPSYKLRLNGPARKLHEHQRSHGSTYNHIFERSAIGDERIEKRAAYLSEGGRPP